MNNTFLLTSTVHHKKFRDRLDAAIEASSSVVVIGFDRKGELRTGCRGDAKVHYLLVDSPVKTSLIRRIIILMLLIVKVIKAQIRFGKPDTVLVNAADLMIIATIFLYSANRKIYDLADINPMQYGTTLVSMVFRRLESLALKLGWEIVVTSPWFYWGYIRSILQSEQQCYLIENKLVGKRQVGMSVLHQKKNQGMRVIGWSGLLRCNRSFEILLDLCERHKADIELNIIGDTTKLKLALINKAMTQRNVRFFGTYLEEEIGDKIADVDFLWACDLSDGLNSQLLLPNRLYQAVFYGKPLISQAGTATAKVVKYFEIGLILKECQAESVASQLMDVTQEQYDRWLSNCILLRERTLRGGEWRDFLVDPRNGVALRIPHNEDTSVVFHFYGR